MNKETYSLVTKLIAVVSSCRTRQQVKVARKYVTLACRRCPDLHHDYYLRALNKIDAQLIADRQPRLNLSRHPVKLPTLLIDDTNAANGDTHADQ